jgi:iron complex outermembrane receptor protein
MGYPISGNAEKSIHQGVELSLESELNQNLTLSGNFSFNDDHFDKYIEYGFDYDAWDSLSFDRSGNRIGGFPEYLSNWRLEWGYDDFRAGLTARLVGSQFIDNGETYKIESYSLFDVDLSYDFGKFVGLNSLILSARMNNIADEKYVPAGYIEFDDNLPRYIVGAERNFYLSLKASL